MGKKSGNRLAGATGKPEPLMADDVVRELQSGDAEDVRDLARAHTADAVETLATAMKGGRKGNRAAWTTRVKAANSIIEHGHGRADTRETKRDAGGLQVVINILGTGQQLENVVSAAEVARNKREYETIDVTPTGDDPLGAALEAALARSTESG